MTTANLPAVPARLVTSNPGQVTQVEQSRAIAEVQAAVFVAQATNIGELYVAAARIRPHHCHPRRPVSPASPTQSAAGAG